MTRPTSADLALALAGGVGLLVSLWACFPLVVDDAFISFRYAGNLVQGHGLVFNPGERLEGYTNLLWTLLVALGLWAGADAEWFARWLGWLCAAACLPLVWWLAGSVTRGLGPGWRGLAVLLVGWSAPLAYWAGAGLETPLFALLWLASRASLARTWDSDRARWSWLATACLLLLPLCRPDGVLPVCTAMAVWLWRDLPRRRRWLICAVALVVGGACYAGWKLAYYGELLPNTFHAKVHGSSVGFGLSYLWSLLGVCPWVVLALLAPLGGRTGPRHPGARPLKLLLAADCIVFGLYIIGVGGDSMPYVRFFAPLLPLLGLLAVVGLGGAASRWPRLRPRLVMVGAAALALGSLAWSLMGPRATHAVRADRIARVGQVVGRHLSRSRPSGDVLAVNTVGALPHAAGLPTVDMLGLTDAQVARSSTRTSLGHNPAHAAANGPYVLSRRPAVVIFGNTSGAKAPLYQSGMDLVAQPDFARRYRLVSTPLATMERQATGQTPPRLRHLRTLVTLDPPGVPYQVADRLGLLFRYSPAGLVHLQEIYALSTEVHMWVRRDP